MTTGDDRRQSGEAPGVLRGDPAPPVVFAGASRTSIQP